MDFTSNVNNRVSRSVSGKVQRLKTGAQYFSFKLKSPPLSKTAFKQIFPFIAQQDGQFDTFTVVLPELATTTGTATGTITVLDDSTYTGASMAAGSISVPVVNENNTGNLKKGDLIKFSNHDKVYMLTSDINLDLSSVNELDIYPPLVTAVDGNTTVVYTDVPIKVYLDEDQQSFIVQADGTYRYELNCVEEI